MQRYGSKIDLQAGHPYHTQVQYQMYITGASYCDLEIYLPKESHTVQIEKDPMYQEVSVPKLLKFFDQIILPELFSKNICVETTCKETLKTLVMQVTDRIDQEKVSRKFRNLKNAL